MSKLSDLPICECLGLRHPIFGFSHSVEVTAAICNAGGLGKMTVALVGSPKHALAAKDWGIDMMAALPR